MRRQKGKMAVLVGGLVLSMVGFAARPGTAGEEATGDAKVLAALDARTEFECMHEPLTRFVERLEKLHQIEIQIDQGGLKEAGIGLETPVTAHVKGTSLRTALNATLPRLGLDWQVSGGGLRITTLTRTSAISAAERAILKSLDDKTSIEFTEEPLSSCVQYWKDFHSIEIQIDERALKEVGIGTDVSISQSLSGVTLRSALNLTLRQIGLDWTIADEVLLITSPEEAQANMVTRTYRVGDLITVRDSEGKLWQDFDSMIELITATIEPEQWEKVGGPGSIAPFESRGAAGLVIRHTPKVHQQVGQLLGELTAMASKQGNGDYPTRQPRQAHKPIFRPEGSAIHPDPAASPGGLMGSDPFAP